MKYKLVTSSSPQGLSNTISLLITEGWEPMGPHQVVVIHSQNRYSGMQHMDTKHETEYSQTMVYKHKNTIEVDIAFYHPDDENGNVDEDKQIFDLEGMLEEYNQKVQNLLLKD